MDVNWGNIVVLAVAIISAIPGSLVLWRQYKQDQADNERQEKEDKVNNLNAGVTAAALAGNSISGFITQINALSTEVGRLREAEGQNKSEIENLKRERVQWQAGIALLINQLVANRIAPVWTPSLDAPTLPNQVQ